MNTKNKKPFIPRDKPKSWVVGISSTLFGLLIAGPLMFLGDFVEIKLITSIGMALFFVCCVISVFSFLVFFISSLSGKYVNIKEQDWSEQLW